MPKFNMGWIYGLCIIGLIIAFIMGGNSTGGSAGKQLAYSDFQTYVAKGYAESIVVNKDNGKLKMFVKPNYIRTVFNAGTKQMGPNPFVEVQYGSVDKLEGFIDAARAQGVFKGGLYPAGRRTYHPLLCHLDIPDAQDGWRRRPRHPRRRQEQGESIRQGEKREPYNLQGRSRTGRRQAGGAGNRRLPEESEEIHRTGWQDTHRRPTHRSSGNR